MTPYSEVKCPRCKGSGEEPVRDEDGYLVRDLCSYCGGCGEWLDIVPGPWMWSACTDVLCDGRGVGGAFCWWFEGHDVLPGPVPGPDECSAHDAANGGAR